MMNTVPFPAAKMAPSAVSANVDGTDDPRRHDKGFTGPLSGRWRYRVGDYRILCAIEDDKLIVLAVGVGHRSAVHR